MPAAVFVLSEDDMRILDALKQKDEAAFMDLVRRWRPAMLQVALSHTRSRAIAEEMLQETWLAVLQGLERFEGRSSLKTWIFGILMNVARRRQEREGRSVSFSALDIDRRQEPTVDPGRFQSATELHPGDWKRLPMSWSGIPEAEFLSKETLQQVRSAIEALPSDQRQVIALRDVNGMTSEEACNVLGLSDTNQRVLLHRARAKVRAVLERYFERSRS
jgi:RNA polymerase sigma-70 factor (ECF subfamily)